MNTAINQIIVAGLTSSVKNFQERLAILMTQNPSFAEQIMRCAEPVAKQVLVESTLLPHLKELFPFEISDVRCRLNEFGDPIMEVYIPKRFEYYVKYEDRYCNGLLSNPELDCSTEKNETFNYRMYFEGWCYIDYKPYKNYIYIDRV